MNGQGITHVAFKSTFSYIRRNVFPNPGFKQQIGSSYTVSITLTFKFINNRTTLKVRQTIFGNSREDNTYPNRRKTRYHTVGQGLTFPTQPRQFQIYKTQSRTQNYRNLEAYNFVFNRTPEDILRVPIATENARNVFYFQISVCVKISNRVQL